MGHQANVKLLRGQVRQAVKELFPELVKSELYQDASKLIKERLDIVHEMVRSELNRIDERQKDIQGLVMRELASGRLPTPSVSEESPESK